MQWPYPLSPSSTAPNFLTVIPEHPWSALIIFAAVLSAKDVPNSQIYLIRTPSSALISTQFYLVLPYFTIFFSLRFYQFTWHFKQYQADAVSRSPGWSWQNLKEKMGALNIQYIIFWLILTHFSVISDLKNSQNLHFHQFSPDLFKGGGPTRANPNQKKNSSIFLSFWHSI